MRTILVVAAADQAPHYAEALALRDFAVESCAAGDAASAIAQHRPAAVVIAPATEVAPAKLVASLQQALRPGCPPLVVVLGRRDASARDLCLIGGAHDVSVDGQPEDVAARVDAAVNGWLRARPRRALGSSFRAQRGRQALELKVADIDPSGVGLSSAEGLAVGELLRFVVPLPDGDLLTWGRVSVADGAPGVRFLALVADERQRIVGAIQNRPRPTTSGAVPLHAASTPLPGSIPTPVPAPRVLSTAAVAPIPTPPPAPITAPPPAAVAAPEAPPAPSAALSIADAIGDSLADHDAPASDSAQAPAPTAEADVLAGALASALEQKRRWPTSLFLPEPTLSVLQAVATEELVADTVDGAPSPAVIVEFVRSISPLERRLFDPVDPPSEFGDPPHARRCLGLRLQLVALLREGEERLAQNPGNWLVDEDLLGQLSAQVKDATAELQRTCDALVAAGWAQKLKDINQFRNALQKAQTDVRALAARFKGEQVAADGNTALLDVAERVPGEEQSTVRRPPPPEATKKPEKLEFQGNAEASPAQRQRRRLVAWGVAFVVACALAVLSWERGPAQLGADAFRDVPNVTGAVLDAENHGAQIVVNDHFQPTKTVLESIEKVVATHGANRFVVRTASGVLVADKKAGAPARIYVRPKN